jgi:hypothetical protein
MAQSYVGKPVLSKGIGGAIRKFVVFAFRGRISARPRGVPAGSILPGCSEADDQAETAYPE